MMGGQDRDQRQLFYEFSLDDVIPRDHLLRRVNVFATAVLSDLHEQLRPFYSDIGRPPSSGLRASARADGLDARECRHDLPGEGPQLLLAAQNREQHIFRASRGQRL